MSIFRSVHQYFSTPKTFVVPYYQRGYKWSLQQNLKKRKKHLEVLLDDLIDEFNLGRENPHHEYYLQGVTVKERDNEIELVDGQQRTTSLFILLCALKQQNLIGEISLDNKLKYNIRKAGNETLQGFINGTSSGDESIQDVAALKRAWQICTSKLATIVDKELFANFLLQKVKLIYIKLDKNQDEARVFSMMNQDKAEMTQTDLIKSNILREASRQLLGELVNQNSNEGIEWQVNQLRSKLASDWDSWRKWWENEDHIEFAKMISLRGVQNEPAMSAIFILYWKIFHPQVESTTTDPVYSNYLFDKFKKVITDKDATTIEAMEVFEKLRSIQKSIEEIYLNIHAYNFLGLLFKGSGIEKKETEVIDILNDYRNHKNDFVKIVRRRYVNQILDGRPPEDFIADILNDNDVYHNQYTTAARQLLRMNVQRINKHGQKFDFSFYQEDNFKHTDIDLSQKRSLEHIQPQTSVYGGTEDATIVQELNALKNTIGNLVLLPRGLNSKLSNKQFSVKKEIVFNEMTSSVRNKFGLWLHTLDVFGKNNDWRLKELESNKNAFEVEFHAFFNETPE